MLKILPSSQGCCSLVKQVTVVTKNVYNTSGTEASQRFGVIYANLQVVSEGINGCFAEVLLPPLLGGPPVTRCTCLQGATSTCRLQVFKGHLHSKALFMGGNKVSFFGDVLGFQIFRMLLYPKKLSTSFCCNGNGCA